MPYGLIFSLSLARYHTARSRFDLASAELSRFIGHANRTGRRDALPLAFAMLNVSRAAARRAA